MKKIANWIKQLNIICRDFIVNTIGGSYLLPKFCRKLLYQMCGIKLQSKNINPKCYFSDNKVSIGKSCYINYMCFFDSSDNIEIGDNCNIAMQCTFITSSHMFGNTNRRAGQNITAPIKVGNGCWVGARTTVLPGITIGNGCIIAAGALVNKNCEEHGVYAGVPAVRIKDL